MHHETKGVDYRSAGVVLLLVAMPVALLAATLALLRGFGLLDPTIKVAGADNLSADLALVGVMVTASVSVIGLILKRQSDQRLQVSRTDKSKQLRLDAAMRAGSLFGSSESSPPDPAAIASGLLALTQLDQANLAVALLVDLWSQSHGPDPHGLSTPGAHSTDQPTAGQGPLDEPREQCRLKLPFLCWTPRSGRRYPALSWWRLSYCAATPGGSMLPSRSSGQVQLTALGSRASATRRSSFWLRRWCV